MIRIFNKVTHHSILIDEEDEIVSFEPKHWHEENPHLIIKIQSIHFESHAETCPDCSEFVNSIGKNKYDWYVEYMGRVDRLDLNTGGQGYGKLMISFNSSAYFQGSILTLPLDKDTTDTLTQELKNKESREDYEACVIIKSKIDAINKQDPSNFNS